MIVKVIMMLVEKAETDDRRVFSCLELPTIGGSTIKMQLSGMQVSASVLGLHLHSLGIDIPERDAKYFVAIDNINTRDLRALDPQVLSAVHGRYYASLYRYAHYKLDDAQAAEDAAGEVFLRMIEALHAGRGPRKNVQGWLFGTLANIVNDQLRERYKRKEPLLNDGSDKSQGDPHAHAEQREQFAAIRKAMHGLTSEQQHVLALRFGSAYSLKKTAEVMGKKPNAVKALQFRALRALRNKIPWVSL